MTHTAHLTKSHYSLYIWLGIPGRATTEDPKYLSVVILNDDMIVKLSVTLIVDYMMIYCAIVRKSFDKYLKI